MRADLSTIQQTLTPEAAAALARAMDEAAQRRHGQTTPLHVAAALLIAPAGLLREACARAAAGGGGAAAAAAGGGTHPLHCRALDLCFSVALDRLPAAGAGAQGGGAAAPPVSNALVAALKRAQAQQRRGCPEAAQQPLLAVKVELEQLVLSILDDPSVSRVMREASFSSAAVKSTIEQSLTSPSPSSSTAVSTPASTPIPFSPSPSLSPLARAGTANTYLNPRLAAAVAGAGGGGGGDDVRKVLEVMLKPARRNPVLVGDAGPDAVLKEAIRRIPTAGSPALAGAKVLPLEAELAKLADDKAAMAERIGELGAMIERLVGEHGAVVLDLGDLKWLVEGPVAAASVGGKAAVAEMGRLLRRFGRGKVWAVATAACATYLRCKIYHAGMEDEWDLQAVSIARSTPLAAAALRRKKKGERETREPLLFSSQIRWLTLRSDHRRGGGEMEAPVGASLGAMGSLLGNLDVLLAPGCRLPKMVKDGMHLLKEDLEELGAHLGELSEAEDPPLTAKCWMKEVRELSYDIEDYIDRSVRPDRPNKISSSSKKRYMVPARANTKKRFMCKISHTNIPKWHKQIAKKISGFRTYVQEAIERHGRYELGSCTLKRRFVSVGPMLPTLYEETAELVIDGRTSEFIDLLANDGDQQLKTVSLVGSGCLGKTTLARVLYNKLGDQFECQAFIRVSQKPDMKRIFCDMLSQVQGKQPPDDCKELHLIDHIRNHLQDRRYLIIIDDLWTTSIWDIINRAFPRNGRCSRIIITTQIEDVALSCCCYRSEYVFELKPLDDYHSRKLFFNRLFGSESDCPQQFKEISNKIVELCGGLPLATVIIASLLASQPVILMDLLTYIHDSLNSYFWAHSSSEGMRQVLNLSYNNLPHYLKTCLLYVSMYAEGYKICKSDMVKQWLAEGFIDTTEGRDIEKVALSYFDELISRRLIQPICINYNNEVLSCTVHDAVRDLIAYNSAEENFIVVIDHYRKNVALSDKVRRLSLHFGDVKYAKTPANIRRSQVRSLTFFGLFECMPSVTAFKLLRVLNLQLSGHGEDHTLDLTGISELFHLRYLKISCDVCVDLPDRMGRLEYLETLDLDTEVTAVPWDIIHLQHLSHLHLPVERDLLDWIGSMRSVSSLCSLGKLNKLRDLHLTCSTPPTDHLERSMEALGSLVGGHGNLQSLALVHGSSHRKSDLVRGAPKVIISWDGFAPPLLLQRFEWLPHSCTFSRVPTWIGVLGNLCVLKIAVRELLMDCVKILRGLPALTAMSLYVQTAPAKMVVFGKEGFSVLKYFKFRCSVSWLKFEVDAMPNLQMLKLGFDAHGADQHGAVPVGIEHLSALKEILAKIGGAGADEPDRRRSAVSALSDAIRMHPGRPTVNIQWVDWMFGGEDDKTSRVQEEEHKTRRRQYGAMKKGCNEQHGVAEPTVEGGGEIAALDVFSWRPLKFSWPPVKPR